MAISYVSGLISGGGNNQTDFDWGTSSLSNISSGDFVIGVVSSYASTKEMSTAPNGTYWTLLEHGDTSTYGSLWIYWAWYSGDLGSNDSFTMTSVASATTYAFCFAFRGVDSTSPIDAEGTIANNAAATTFNPPSVTVATSGAAVVSVSAGTQEATSNDVNNLINNPSSGYTCTSGLAWTSTSGNDACCMAQYKLNCSTGSNDPAQTATCRVSATSMEHTFALKPSAGGGTPLWVPADPMGMTGVYAA